VDEVILPRFVQSGLLRSAEGFYHAFLGIDPLPGRGEEERLRAVFSVPPDRIGVLRQVHSGIALEREEGDEGIPGGGRREGDSLWTAETGTGAAVRTADCVPILFAHPGLGLCGAIHAGWRGLTAGVIGSTVEGIDARFGDSAVEGILAAVGPSARGCCYEVGEEVADLLRRLPGGATHLRKGGSPGKWLADLPSLAVEMLAGAGIPRHRLEAVGPCTVCSRDFHSWRREKSLTGRQLSFIYKVEISSVGRHSPRNGRTP
jgi:purine-nucleoside/S-methyl-5'-thioadenosine phosphorylase / adenosine deaminase